MIKAIVTATLLFFSLPAFAGHHEGGATGGGHSGAGSEFFYQSAKGAQDVTPEFTYYSSTIKSKTAAGVKTKLETSGYILGAEYEYGFNEQWAFGGALAYQAFDVETTSTTSSDIDATGLKNIELYAKGTSPTGPGLLRYGGTLSLSPGDIEVKSDGDTNAYTGGHSFEPYVGYEMAKDKCIYGARLKLDFELSEKTQDNATGADTEIEGAEKTEFAVFYEHLLKEDMRLGASFAWTTVEDVETKTGIVKTKSDSVTPLQTISLYAPKTLAHGVLLPKFTYVLSSDDKINTTKVEDYSIWSLEVGYRIEL
jgi:hypothetical protein